MKEFLLSSLFYLPAGSIDSLSTHYALSKCPNCVEGNQLMARGGIPIKIGMSESFALIDSKSSRKTKIAMRVTYLAINLSLGAWNLHQAKKYGSSPK